MQKKTSIEDLPRTPLNVIGFSAMTTRLLPPFDPPYESPIEEAFAWRARTTLRPELNFSKQSWARTVGGNFRLDFLAQDANQRKIAFECDGKDYHDHYRDTWRDALILADAQCDVIYRLRGKDLWCRTDDLMYIISKLEPQLFSERGLSILSSLATKCAKAADIDPKRDLHCIWYDFDEKDEDAEQAELVEKLGEMCFERHELIPGSPLDDLSSAYWNFALEMRGASFDQIIAAWKRLHPNEG